MIRPAAKSITLSDPADIMFSSIAQGALVNNTTLPSGFVTPDVDMVIVGKALVVTTREEWEDRVSGKYDNSRSVQSEGV